ncbi:MAG: 1-acyl-sn-glycerol-3-phosphate acyltransferase [Clostridia bacterium]|nr:1-acyl-sn-glycerol-3-phosphate acyltransferase [Clostridia bacterium]
MSESNRSKPNYFWYDLAKITAAVPFMIWMRPKLVYETEAAKRSLRKGGALLVANHDSMYDPMYLLTAIWYRRQHFVCIKELAEHNALTRWIFRQFHCIPIDRDNFSMASLRAITDDLKEGHIVSMFPEGHVNTDSANGIAPFKSGMVLIALQSGCPIVPVYIKKPKHLYNRLVVNIGEPVDVRAMYGERPSLADINAAAEKLHEKEELLKAI